MTFLRVTRDTTHTLRINRYPNLNHFGINLKLGALWQQEVSMMNWYRTSEPPSAEETLAAPTR